MTEVVRALGSVQVDPVASVARAERMVLFSRLGPYDVAELEAALARGELFEYWAHIVATSDYGIHREAMRRYPRGDLTRARYIREWVAANAAFRRYVLAELRRRGPLLSRDLEDRSTVPWRTGGWNDGKGVGRMLDILWFGGEITIVGREGNERVWDLAARRLPQDEPRWRPARGRPRGRGARPPAARRRAPGTSSAACSTAFHRAPRRRGSRSFARGWPSPCASTASTASGGRTVTSSTATPVPAGPCSSPPSTASSTTASARAELFGFRYRLEMYVAPAKREYGYYVLPLLHGTELIGRVDATFDRTASVLRVDGVWAERGAPADAGPDVGGRAPRARGVASAPTDVRDRPPRAARLGGSAPCLSPSGCRGSAPRPRREAGRRGRGPPHRRPVAAPRRDCDGRARDRPPARVPAARPDRDAWRRRSTSSSGAGSGRYDVAELDRLLWRSARSSSGMRFVWPIEELPLVRGLMRRWRTSTHYKAERWVRDFLDENRAFRRYVLRELERRGPLLSRELEDRSLGEKEERRWYGSRNVGLMLTSLHLRGEVAVAGRRGGQRLWDLGRARPPGHRRAADCAMRSGARGDGASARSACAPRAGGWEAHPEAVDGDVPDRVTFLSPFDRLIHDRDRAEALFGFHYRLEMFVPKAKRVYGYYVLPILRGTAIIGRIEPVFDRKRGDAPQSKAPGPSRARRPTPGAAIRDDRRRLAAWLGAESVEVGRTVPRAWAKALRG